MIGPPFAGYAPFPSAAAVLPPRGHHPAFYPQPILYWGYPSPPVSPTTYYGPAPPHVGPPHHQPALVSSFFFNYLLFDFFSYFLVWVVRQLFDHNLISSEKLLLFYDLWYF